MLESIESLWVVPLTDLNWLVIFAVHNSTVLKNKSISPWSQYGLFLTCREK
jgi:hypothetical protein